MTQKEFLFDYSAAQVLLLVDTWATRQAKMWGGGKKESEGPVKSRTHPNAKPGSLADAYALKGLLG
jgi:hypothetical protein